MSVCAPTCGQVLTEAEVERVRDVLVGDRGWDSVISHMTNRDGRLVELLLNDYDRLRTRSGNIAKALETRA